MTNNSDSLAPEAVLERAARAASEMLPRLEGRLQELQREIELLNLQITRVRHLASFSSTIEMPQEPSTPGDEKKASDDIDLVLETSEPLKVAELREQIKQKTGRVWAESTLYGYLGKGKGQGRYANENNRWSLTDVGRIV